MPAPTLPQSAPPTTFLSTSTFGAVLNGTSGNDQLTAKAGRVALVGGLGDDTYYTFASSASYSATSTRVLEYPNAGIDSVFTPSNMKIEPYIENLTLTNTGGSRYAIGNFGNNAITSGAGNDFLTTGGGNDVLTGGPGRDSFTFTTQANTTSWIADFDPLNDRIILTNHGFSNLAAVKAASQQVGVDLQILLPNAQKVMVANATAADLTTANVLVDTPSGAAARHLTFSDEFDGPLSLRTGAAGTSNNIWKTSFQNGLRLLQGNNDEQIYVDPDYRGNTSSPLGLNPFSIADGILTISARPTPPALLPALWNIQYTSGMLTTQTSFQQQYGYFEIRAQSPVGAGMFPAFWMQSTDGVWPPEIDIYEQIGNLPDYVSQGVATIAGPFENRGTHTGIDMTAGFHTYGLEWTAQTLTWFIDGQISYQIATPVDLHKPMYLTVTFAVGGNWPGSPPPNTDWSKADMKIDYIRGYSLEAVTSTAQIVISNATDPHNLSDSFTLPPGAPGSSATFTGVDMAIAGVAAASSVTATYSTGGDVTLVNNAAWNAIKNATINGGAAHGVDVRNFVDVEITLGDGDNVVAVTGAKRGTISTAGGNDVITVNGTSNSGSDNLLRIIAGDGDDDATFTGGAFSRTSLDGEAGNDKLALRGQAFGAILGGTGDDVLVDFSTGAVTLTGGGGADGFAFNRSVKATVLDYTPGVDHIELIGLTPAEVQVSLSGSDTLLGLSSTGSVRLSGVSLALADLDLRFLSAPSSPPHDVVDVMKVILSNASNPADLSDSFQLPPPAPSTVATFTGADMSIAGVASSVVVSASYAADGNLTLINQSAWNAIKNATVHAGSTSGVDVRNFVDVEITTSDIVDTVRVTDAKRGTISTGDGGDRIIVNGTSNSNLDNVITVRGGNGNDNISFDGGKFSKADIDGEVGNDLITVTSQAFGTVKGGSGDDVLKDQSSGALTFNGGAGIDTFSFTASGQSTVQDYEVGIDRVELVGVTAAQVSATINGADTVLNLGGGASVKLIGVQLTIDQIDPIFA